MVCATHHRLIKPKIKLVLLWRFNCWMASALAGIPGRAYSGGIPLAGKACGILAKGFADKTRQDNIPPRQLRLVAQMPIIPSSEQA